MHVLIEDKKLKFTPKRIEALHSLGIEDLEGLLSYYPFRYDVLNNIPFAEWKEKEKVTFEGEVISDVRSFRFGRNRTSSRFDVRCGDTVLHVTIFNRPWAKQLRLNTILTITGIYNGKYNVTAMNYQLGAISEKPRVTPVYNVKAGVQQRTIRECMKRGFVCLAGRIKDRIPERYKQAYRLEQREDALYHLHFPNSENEIKQSYRTLKYEEFLCFFLAMHVMREQQGQNIGKTGRRISKAKIEKLIASMPFTPTEDQQRTIQDILKDMRSEKVMYRLVQGDVGCGKTFVAAVALYGCVLAGYQGALLAPTEILARQHLSALQGMLKDFGIRMEVLYSGLKQTEKNRIMEAAADGSIDLLIGTHSLLQENVKFKKLGLVVADEQQRFGVAQRRALREKGHMVDFLLMSATPIPRTLATTLYGDMDVSTIETMPEGRKPVTTKLIKENSFRSVLSDIKDLLAAGHQLYVICAAVEENDMYEARDVQQTGATLAKLFAPAYKVGILHGRMSSEEKQTVMRSFAENEVQILVSTTVVEVGMNVVNATGMIVYDADRFGMSQLHQLRGRVQRGSSPGFCWLLTDSKDERSLERLEVLVKTSDGFKISYEDLRMRGPGDMLGTRQSGVPDLILGNIVEDTNIMNTARKDAADIYETKDDPDNAEIMRVVYERNRENAQFVD